MQNENEGNKKKKRSVKPLITVLFILLLSAMLFDFFSSDGALVKKGTITYTQFMKDVKAGEIESVTIISDSVLSEVVYKEGEVPDVSTQDKKDIKDKNTELPSFLGSDEPKLVDGKRVETVLNPGYDEFYKEAAEQGVEVQYKSVTDTASLFGIIFNLLSIGLTCLLIFFFLKTIRGFGSGGAGSMGGLLGGTSTKEAKPVKSTVLFSDVAGLTEEKEEMLFAIDSLKNLEKYAQKGAKSIKGIILEGPPGVGKTLLAKAVAGEAGVNFLSYSGSDFVEMFAGLGASRVRKMFTEAEKQKPCVVFIDEFESLGKSRGNGFSGGDREADQTLTALLERMDGVNSLDGILFIAATNKVESLDKAITRPGRFGKIIHVAAPRTKEDREAVVRVHAMNKTFAEGLTIEKIAKHCYGLTGAEIADVLNEAIYESFKAKKGGTIDLTDIDKAVMKQYAKGLAKGKHSEKDRLRVAIHEAGHAIMDTYVGRKVIKVSIQPYSSGIGGVTVTDGESREAFLSTAADILNDVKTLFGGKVAEEVMLGDCSVGASNDLERATLLIRDYICTYGMKDGTLLSRMALMKEAMKVEYDDAILEQMEEVLQATYKEVLEYFSKPDVKEKIQRIADRLIDNETIYSLEEYSKEESKEESTNVNLDKSALKVDSEMPKITLTMDVDGVVVQEEN